MLGKMVLAHPSHSSDAVAAAAGHVPAGMDASGSLPAQRGIAQTQELWTRHQVYNSFCGIGTLQSRGPCL